MHLDTGKRERSKVKCSEVNDGERKREVKRGRE